MNYKKKTRGYFIFAFAGIIVIYVIAVVIIQFILFDKRDEFVSYLNYTYNEYVDRSDTLRCTRGGGAQLYEAENAERDGGSLSRNTIASGGLAMSQSNGSSLTFSIFSDEEQTVLLTLRTLYLSENETDISAANLFSLKLNGVSTDVRGVSVMHSESLCDFKSNRLCELLLQRGENNIRLECGAIDYILDYIVLTPRGVRTENTDTIQVLSGTFDSFDSRQYYNVQDAVTYGGTCISSSSVNGRYYVRQDAKEESISFFIDSARACETEISVCLNNYGDKAYVSDACILYVNDLLYKTEVSVPVTKKGAAFAEYSFGKISLTEGENVIELYCENGGYAVNYVALNADVDFSPTAHTSRFEAEDGVLTGGCRKEYNSVSSGNYNVGYNTVDSTVGISFRAMASRVVRLALGISLIRDKTELSRILEVTVNGMLLDLENIYLPSTGGYNVYSEFDIGNIAVMPGENKINVRCLMSSAYNLDYFSLYTETVTTDKRYEAERGARTGGCWVENAKPASEGRDVGCNVRNSSVSFSFYAEREKTLSLYAAFGTISSGNLLMSDIVTISLNGTPIDIYNILLHGTGGWRIFAENKISDVHLQRGVNVITITSKAEQYNLDYIYFTLPEE